MPPTHSLPLKYIMNTVKLRRLRKTTTQFHTTYWLKEEQLRKKCLGR